MASKKRHKQKHQIKQPQQAPTRPGHRLDEARSALAAGNPLVAIDLATKALKANLDPPLRSHGQRLLTEAHFRAAAATPAPEERLAHLESASRLQPQQARLHHHAGVTLLRMGRAIEAKQALSVALTLDPNRPGLRFSHQLARLVSGEAWVGDGLTEVELNSLRLAQALVAGEGQPKLAGRFAGQSFVGQADGLWQLLLQMADQPKFSPAARYASERVAAPHLAENPIVAYYAGVVAFRKGDKSTALPIWQHLAAAKTLRSLGFKVTTHGWCVNKPALGRRRAVGGGRSIAAEPSRNRSRRCTGGDLGRGSLPAGVSSRCGRTMDPGGSALGAGRSPGARPAHSPKPGVGPGTVGGVERRRHRLAGDGARRPRKSDHPDSLTDDQVAAIWRHAADCYAQIKDLEQEIACLRYAVKYKEHDPELSMRLADACMAADRVEAARNELERLLAITPDHLQALGPPGGDLPGVRPGQPHAPLAAHRGARPRQPGCKGCTGALLLELAEQHEAQGFLGRLTKRNEKQQLKILQEGLKEIPGHPILLLAVGIAQHHRGNNRAAQGACARLRRRRPATPVSSALPCMSCCMSKAKPSSKSSGPLCTTVQGCWPPFGSIRPGRP